MTLLEAPYTIHSLEGDKPELRQVFNVASANDMRRLGVAFAQVVRNPETPLVRVGVVADVGCGKTTFIQGMLNAIEDKTCIESTYASFREQALWQSPTAGWIRHYDAMIMWEGDGLPAYLNNDIARCKPTLVDLVEHPASDQHNKKFDYLAFVEWGNSEKERVVTIAAAEPDSERMRKFLRGARP